MKIIIKVVLGIALLLADSYMIALGTEAISKPDSFINVLGVFMLLVLIILIALLIQIIQKL